MKPGTKPIDFAAAVRRGVRRTSRHGKAKDQPNLGATTAAGRWPTLPSGLLRPTGRKEWFRLRRLLQNGGGILEVDFVVLLQFCVMAQRLLEDPDGFKATDHNSLRLLAETIGVSPPGRGRLRGGSGD